MELKTLTNRDRQCSQARNSFHWTAIQRLRSVANLWGFVPATGISIGYSAWVLRGLDKAAQALCATFERG